MEERRGFLTYFSGIIRLIAFIVLVIILIFFVIRWAGNRNAEKKAEQAVKTAVNDTDKKENDSNSEATDKKSTDASDESVAESNGGRTVVEVPSGVADSEATPSTGPSVPSTGIGEDIALTAFLMSTCVYLYFKNRQTTQWIKTQF